jgi:hypothetical protein
MAAAPYVITAGTGTRGYRLYTIQLAKTDEGDIKLEWRVAFYQHIIYEILIDRCALGKRKYMKVAKLRFRLSPIKKNGGGKEKKLH